MRIFVSDPLNRQAVQLLAGEGFEVLEQHELAGPELGSALRGSAALIVRGKTKVTRDVLDLADGLRIVCRAGSGVDNIDLEAARDKGVAVFNTPGANSQSVVELTWALILALHRRLVRAACSTSSGRWEKKKFSGSEVQGRTLGVIGYGQIGSQVARVGVALGCRVLVNDPYIDVDSTPDVTACSLETLLTESDIVTLHLPLTDETQGILNAERLAVMKAGAVLVNCARGGLVDERALKDSLVTERLSGAALDVFAEEPPTDKELLALPQVISTPHIGAATTEAQERAGLRAAETVRDFLAGRSVPGRVV